MRRKILWTLLALTLTALIAPTGSARAQGVTGSGLTGLVKDAQGAVVPGATITAVHNPSSTTYTAVSQGDGRYVIPEMRVGGPYTVSAELQGFRTEKLNDITLSLGVISDLSFTLQLANVQENITVVATTSPVFASTRTGAATSVTRDDLATVPTISGRITDITRLTPQYGGSGTFVGQDNRSNNITIDGSYFNNSFGLGTTTGGPGDRTGVAPISLEVIEQVQVNVAPYDVRQGNFVGANVNSVTRSGTNMFTGSVYTRYRNQSFVGTEANGQAFNPGTFKTTDTGEWVGGPIIKSKLFFFQSFEKQQDNRPLTTFLSNPGGAPVAGNITRVNASDLTALSSFLKTNFNYDTGPFDNIPKITPAKPWMIKGNYNISSTSKVSFRYNQLDSNTDVLQSGSSSLGVPGRSTNTSNYLSYQNTNYKILENIKSGIGQWNTVFGTWTNDLTIGNTKNDESRADIQLFPFVEIGDGAGGALTAFGSEPFTPFNLLRYHTFQAQDSVTKFAKNHQLTFGGMVEKFHSDNSFYFGIQSSYSYASLQDFYTDAQGYLANPNRAVAPVTATAFQVKFLLQPGQTTPPLQPLDVWYGSGYVQDQWRPRTDLTVTAGLRFDIPSFGDTAFDNPIADQLTFRDQSGNPVKYQTGQLPSRTTYWSPRVGFNWDVLQDQSTQIRGGSGLFTGKPPYVWISNQIGNTGVLYGFLDQRGTTAYPFNPNPDKYKPAPTGSAASSYELDVTDPSFRFPQTWRTNIGGDRKLPWGIVGTLDYIYNRDINDPVYINANLPAAQTAYVGVDARPRWATSANVPSCSAATVVSCVTRLNNQPGNQVTANYVILNSNQNRSWNISGAVSKPMYHGVQLRGGFNYGVSRSLVEPSSTAGSSWGSANPIVNDPNNPPLAYSSNSPGKRVFAQVNYSHQWFKFGATTVGMFYDARPNIVGFGPNTSFIFSNDANGDSVSGNDLIYIPRNTSEMNFKNLTNTAGVVLFTPDQQAAAFEQLIENDPYLSKHRGEYAQRNAVFFPVVNRIDLSLMQDVFKSLGGNKHTGQIRLDITNFGNLLNHNWGVGTRIINNQVLTNAGVDAATGKMNYNLQTLNGQLLTATRQTSAGIADVYVMMLSFRYGFN